MASFLKLFKSKNGYSILHSPGHVGSQNPSRERYQEVIEQLGGQDDLNAEEMDIPVTIVYKRKCKWTPPCDKKNCVKLDLLQFPLSKIRVKLHRRSSSIVVQCKREEDNGVKQELHHTIPISENSCAELIRCKLILCKCKSGLMVFDSPPNPTKDQKLQV